MILISILSATPDLPFIYFNVFILSPQVPNKEYFAELIQNKDEKHKAEIERLMEKIAQLEVELHETKLATIGGKNVSAVNKEDAEGVAKAQQEGYTSCQYHMAHALFYTDFLKGKLEASEVTQGVSLHNEYEIIPFVRFTLKRIYLVDPGMGKRVVEKPIGFKKKDLQEAIAYGIEKLNQERKAPSAKKYMPDDFVEGIYRTEPSLGSHYDLVFRDLDNQTIGNYVKVVLTRSFAPMQLVAKESINAKRETINLILPLSGRTEKFQGFLNRFARVCIKGDKNVFLTVVYFGTEGLNEVKNLMGQISKQYRFKNMKLVTLNENFSRGRGLQVGAQSWLDGDVLLFLCDVDIVFNMEFLDRCRLNTERGKRVYYPMVFSLYNPNVVYRLHNLDVPSEEDQLIISKDTGFWRDFGFGMTCQYRSDFLSIKGFDEEITGWGMEDVYLYRKYVKSDLMVVRATDPGIFHLWHEKQCDPEADVGPVPRLHPLQGGQRGVARPARHARLQGRGRHSSKSRST